MTSNKDPRFALLLGLFPLLFMFGGLGQIYAGRRKRGIAIMLLGWFFGGMMVAGVASGVGVCLAFPATLCFVLWQAWDAKKCAEEANQTEIARRQA